MSSRAWASPKCGIWNLKSKFWPLLIHSLPKRGAGAVKLWLMEWLTLVAIWQSSRGLPVERHSWLSGADNFKAASAVTDDEVTVTRNMLHRFLTAATWSHGQPSHQPVLFWQHPCTSGASIEKKETASVSWKERFPPPPWPPAVNLSYTLSEKMLVCIFLGSWGCLHVCWLLFNMLVCCA